MVCALEQRGNMMWATHLINAEAREDMNHRCCITQWPAQP